MHKTIYNPLKLSEYRPLFHNKKVLIVGAGAVGTYLMEFLAKMGLSPDAVDFDTFTLENAAKHSCLIRTPDDADQNKAQCAAYRIQPLLDNGCTSNGIDSDLCKLGPEAFASYDIVVAAVDNYDAKVLLNELIRSIPVERRPIVIVTGTYDEMAQSVILDNNDFCLRCLIDENWMKDSSIRTSCSGPQIREIDGRPEIVRTSNLASSLAAHLSAEQIRGYILGTDNVMNRRITYTAYPNLEIHTSYPMHKHNCPGCIIQPPSHIEWIHGNTLDLKLKDAMKQISNTLSSNDFEISVHRLNYRKVVYGGFIISDVCRSCGTPITVMKHGGRVFIDDLLCSKCRSSGKHGTNRITNGNSSVINAFNAETDCSIQEMTLYNVGYPLGAHLEVIQRNNAIDFLDTTKIKTTIFALDGDSEKIHHITKLNN